VLSPYALPRSATSGTCWYVFRPSCRRFRSRRVQRPLSCHTLRNTRSQGHTQAMRLVCMFLWSADVLPDGKFWCPALLRPSLPCVQANMCQQDISAHLPGGQYIWRWRRCRRHGDAGQLPPVAAPMGDWRPRCGARDWLLGAAEPALRCGGLKKRDANPPSGSQTHVGAAKLGCGAQRRCGWSSCGRV